MPTYKSREVVVLYKDPFAIKENRSAVIISSATRPRESDRDNERTHTVTPLTKDLDTFGSHPWAVVLDKSNSTIGRDLDEDSVAEVWETLPVTDDAIIDRITRLTEDANREIAQAHAAMVFDDDP
jgi:PemK-like protein.